MCGEVCDRHRENVGGDALSKEGLFSRAFWDAWVRMLVNSIHGEHMLRRRDADVQCETATREGDAEEERWVTHQEGTDGGSTINKMNQEEPRKEGDGLVSCTYS